MLLFQDKSHLQIIYETLLIFFCNKILTVQGLLEMMASFKNTQNSKCLLSFQENTLNQKLGSFKMHCFVQNLEELLERLHLSCASLFKVILISEFTIPSHFCRNYFSYLEMTILMYFLPMYKYQYSTCLSPHYLVHLYSSNFVLCFGNFMLKDSRLCHAK